MPGYLYNSYCHETLDDVADQFVSTPVYADGYSPDGTYLINLDDSLTFFGSFSGIRSNGQLATVAADKTYLFPSCDSPGYLPYLPGTVADFVPLWAAALSVIAVAYAVRMAKVALGQGRM